VSHVPGLISPGARCEVAVAELMSAAKRVVRPGCGILQVVSPWPRVARGLHGVTLATAESIFWWR